MQDDLHRLDLEQHEVLSKLQVRLNSELALHYKHTEMIALRESERDQILCGAITPENRDKALADVEAAINEIQRLQTNVLLTLKSSVWNASNNLKRLHDTRRNLREAEDQTEE
jgi:hypothetical protein